jgi:hypothetical protein
LREQKKINKKIKVVSALNIGIGVSAYRLRLMKKYRYRIGPKKSVSVDPYPSGLT